MMAAAAVLLKNVAKPSSSSIWTPLLGLAELLHHSGSSQESTATSSVVMDPNQKVYFARM